MRQLYFLCAQALIAIFFSFLCFQTSFANDSDPCAGIDGYWHGKKYIGGIVRCSYDIDLHAKRRQNQVDLLIREYHPSGGLCQMEPDKTIRTVGTCSQGQFAYEPFSGQIIANKINLYQKIFDIAIVLQRVFP